ncbi:MAG TPA: hypothetical protein VFO31_30730 [Vicinamibacterales bacterium]|nr:hypothetical protein [Vicinamibacterales bacterium]
MTRRTTSTWTLALAVAAAVPAAAHSGPPYAVVTHQIAGPYRLSLWTDPDATDDRTPGGQFWVVIEPGRDGAVPPATRARVAIRPLDGRADAPFVEATAVPVDGDVTRQYAGLVMDHEGPFAVRVIVDGPWGGGAVGARVQATYDLRPPLPLLGIYMLPFLAVGFLWTARLLRRRRARRDGPSGPPAI